MTYNNPLIVFWHSSTCEWEVARRSGHNNSNFTTSTDKQSIRFFVGEPWVATRGKIYLMQHNADDFLKPTVKVESSDQLGPPPLAPLHNGMDSDCSTESLSTERGKSRCLLDENLRVALSLAPKNFRLVWHTDKP